MYQPALRTSPLMAQPLAGGPPDTLIACVIGTALAVSDNGIYYVTVLRYLRSQARQRYAPAGSQDCQGP